jgi:hypothetical protein
MTPRTVEVFLAGERIAGHIRGSGDGKQPAHPHTH